MTSRAVLLTPLVASLVGLGLGPPAALGYGESTHFWLTYRAVPEAIANRWVASCGPADAAAFRRFLYFAMASHPSPWLRARFVSLYPTVADFDAWAEKEWLGLNPEARVFGIDLGVPSDLRRGASPPVGKQSTTPGSADGAGAVDVHGAAGAARDSVRLGDLLALASTHPDADHRNENRFQHQHRRRLQDPFGRPLPADPATLSMGALEGLSSQAHAHYGLARLRFSSNPLILWRDPRRFAMPDDVLTFGPAFAQTYADLALLATLSDLPGSDCLAGLFAGAALHHLEDLSQPTHTVQVGAPRFLSGAVRDWLGEEIESLGGLLRSRPSFRSIGIGIIRNHHVLEEALLDQAIRTEARRHRQIEAWRQSQAPSVEEAQVLEAATRDDAELGELLRRSLPAAGQDRVLSFGEAIADALVELSSRRAAALYGLVYDLANPELRDIGFQVAGGVARPDSLLRPAGEAALVAKRAALRESWRASLGRGGTAVRLWLSYHDAVLATVSPDGLPGLRTQLLSRLGERLLAAHQATLARRRQYVPAPPEMERVNVWAPLLFLFALLAAALAGRRLAAWQAAGERDDGDAEQERDRA